MHHGTQASPHERITARMHHGTLIGRERCLDPVPGMGDGASTNMGVQRRGNR